MRRVTDPKLDVMQQIALVANDNADALKTQRGAPPTYHVWAPQRAVVGFWDIQFLPTIVDSGWTLMWSTQVHEIVHLTMNALFSYVASAVTLSAYLEIVGTSTIQTTVQSITIASSSAKFFEVRWAHGISPYDPAFRGATMNQWLRVQNATAQVDSFAYGSAQQAPANPLNGFIWSNPDRNGTTFPGGAKFF